jgi:cytochrome P450
MTVTGESSAATAPGPRGSLLLGMATDLQRDQLGTLERATVRYGDVVRLAAGPPGRRVALYLVSHPDGVQQVLADNAHTYTKDTPFYREIAAYLGDGILTSDGPRWRQQRRTLAPLFTHRHIDRQVAAMVDEAQHLVARWSTDGPARRVDLHAEFTHYTLRVLGRTLFGADIDEAFPVIRETFPILGEHVRRRARNPLRLPRRWPTAAQRRAAEARRLLYQAVDAIIDRRRRQPGEDADLISQLLGARDPQNGAALSRQDLRDQVLIFLLAGHETTSTALTFTCHLLGQHLDTQQRVHDEVDKIIGSRPPTADDLPRLAYTAMVIKEAMRLYPPAPTLGRLAQSADQIAGYHIPPGSVVLISPWVTHRRPDMWPDPDRFDPDRFQPTAAATRHRYSYIPFAGGPRGCIGSHFAITEAVAAAAIILNAYTLRTAPDRITLTTGITLRPASPVPCELVARPAGTINQS